MLLLNGQNKKNTFQSNVIQCNSTAMTFVKLIILNSYGDSNKKVELLSQSQVVICVLISC